VSDVQVSASEAIDPLVLAVDAGTSSVRALVYDGRARSVKSWEVHQPYALTTTPDGGVHADPRLLVGLFASCVDGIRAMVTSSGREIAAVACDTFWHSVMGLGGDGEPLTPVYTWADTRSAGAAAELQKRLDRTAIHARTGVVLHSSYWPAKLRWLMQEEPVQFRSVQRWVSFAEYAYLRFFGEPRVSMSMASGTGLFDQNGCRWDAEMLEASAIHEKQLSPLADFDDVMTGLLPEWARRWPELSHVPWYLAVGDGAANNIGSGGTGDDVAVVMIGTSGALRVVRAADHVETPPGLWTYRVDRKRFVQGGALSAGGNVFAWAVKNLHVPDPDSLTSDVAAMSPDAHGLTVLPFFAGERSPDWNVDAISAVVGITLDTEPAQIVRALLEAVTYRFGLVYRILQHEIPSVSRIIGSGAGLLHSPAWMQMMTDVLGQPVTASAVPEASSRGAAMLVLESLKAVEDASTFPVPLGTLYATDADRHRVYCSAMDRQEYVYTRLLHGLEYPRDVRSEDARTGADTLRSQSQDRQS
jgi:gluconokinase